MSVQASFLRIRVTDLAGLADALSRAHTDRNAVAGYLKASATRVVTFDGPAHIFGTLLVYLLQHRSIDLMSSPYTSLMQQAAQVLRATWVFLTNDHSVQYLNSLNARDFDVAKLGAFYNSFTQTNAAGAAEIMLRGITTLENALRAVDPDFVVALIAG